MKRTINFGYYHWQGQPIPPCDSCKKEEGAEVKIYTDKNGIRLCKDCFAILKARLNGVIKNVNKHT